MTDIVNITYTVHPKVAKGRERFKNITTGEEWWGNDPDEPELDFGQLFAFFDEPVEEPAPKAKAKPKAKK